MSQTEDTLAWNVRPPNLDPDNPLPSTDCQHDDLVDLFFTPDEEERYWARKDREHQARAVCAGCPFIRGCGEHALEHEDYGVWGGMTEQDRRSFGGRGLGGGRVAKPKTTVKRMIRAGVASADIEALVRHAGQLTRRERAA